MSDVLNGLVQLTYPLYASEQIQLREIHTSYNHVSLCWGNAVCQPNYYLMHPTWGASMQILLT